MKFFKNVTIILCILMCGSVLANDKFENTLKHHLNSITARNYIEFEKTITKEKEITLILPNGKLSKTRTEYLAMMKDWFGDSTWTMKYEIIKKEKTKDMGYVLLYVNYDEMSPENKLFHIDYYLLLIFKRNNGEWYLVHDQNTGIS